MKFLLDNFSDENTTQALYLNKHINDLGHTSSIRVDPNQSIFDTFDTIDPDIYITSIKTLSQDAILYFKENPNKNISLILCANGSAEDLIDKTELFLSKNNVECLFFFGNNQNIKSKKYRFVTMQEAADLNISITNSLDYKVDKAVIVTDRSIIKKYSGTYHVISLNEHMKKCDFYSPVAMLSSIYHKYNEIILTDFNGYIPQVFFDAVYRGLKVYYDINDINIEQKADETFGRILKVDDKLNYNNANKLADFKDLQQLVVDKHTGLNRAKTLLSQLPQQVVIGDTK